MPKQEYTAGSPYVDTPQTNWYLLPITLRLIDPDPTDTTMIVGARYVNRPDLLSYDLYGTPSYWWTFMIRNMDVIRDPIWDMKSDITIWIPTRTRLQRLLG